MRFGRISYTVYIVIVSDDTAGTQCCIIGRSFNAATILRNISTWVNKLNRGIHLWEYWSNCFRRQHTRDKMNARCVGMHWNENVIYINGNFRYYQWWKWHRNTNIFISKWKFLGHPLTTSMSKYHFSLQMPTSGAARNVDIIQMTIFPFQRMSLLYQCHSFSGSLKSL